MRLLHFDVVLTYPVSFIFPVFNIVIIFQVPIYIIFFLNRLDRMGRLRFICLLSFCRDSLASLFCETRLLALCSTPVTLEDLGFCVGVFSLSGFSQLSRWEPASRPCVT